MVHTKSTFVSISQIKSNPEFSPTATLFSVTKKLKEQKMNFIPISKTLEMSDFPHFISAAKLEN